MDHFADRYGPWAVVTGAAAGVGLAFTRSCVERGLSVVLVDRDPAVAEVVGDLEGHHRAVVADLADPGWIDAVATATSDVEVGLAIANAAVSYVGPFLDQPRRSTDAIIDVACRATVAMAQWALAPMVERGRGGFVVTSSGSALAGTGGVATYSASKAFVLNIAEAVGWELRDTGVDVAAVVGPSMDTPGFRDAAPDAARMIAPAVDPHDVTERTLDALPEGGTVFGDDGLAFAATLPRHELVEMISSVTTGMYPDRFG